MELIDLLSQYLIIIAPSLASILGTIITVIICINKGLAAINQVKSTKEFADVKAQLKVIADENQELIKANKLLTDKIAKIEGYSDAVNQKTQN